MNGWGAAAYGIAAAIYAALAFFELWGTRYTHSAGFLLKCRSFYAYLAVSAVIGALSLGLFNGLVLSRMPSSSPETQGLIGDILRHLADKPLLQGLFVGLTARGFLNLSFMSLPIGSGVPLGPRLILQGIEDKLLKRLFVDHYNQVAETAADLLRGKASNLGAIKKKFAKAVPSGMDDRTVIIAEIKSAQSPNDLMIDSILRLGYSWTKRNAAELG